MQVGYFAMPLHPPGADPTRTLEDDLAQIVMLDELGYKEAWIGEHFTTVWENIPAPDLFIAMALAKTKNIVLGTGVSVHAQPQPLHAGAAHRPTRPPGARPLSLGRRLPVASPATSRCSASIPQRAPTAA